MKSPTDSPFIRLFFFWNLFCFFQPDGLSLVFVFFFFIFYQFLGFFCVLFDPITMICFELCVFLFHLLVCFFVVFF